MAFHSMKEFTFGLGLISSTVCSPICEKYVFPWSQVYLVRKKILARHTLSQVWGFGVTSCNAQALSSVKTREPSTPKVWPQHGLGVPELILNQSSADYRKSTQFFLPRSKTLSIKYFTILPLANYVESCQNKIGFDNLIDPPRSINKLHRTNLICDYRRWVRANKIREATSTLKNQSPENYLSNTWNASL